MRPQENEDDAYDRERQRDLDDAAEAENYEQLLRQQEQEKTNGIANPEG